MRPEEKRTTKRRYGQAHARLLLKKNLGWLPGFPVAVDSDTVRWHTWPWTEPGRSQIVSLNRETIRRMEMALQKLRYHFPRALPQIVGDVEDWLARMEGLLEVLKGALHRHEPVDVNALLEISRGDRRWLQRFRRLRAARPELASLLEAVAFLEFTARRQGDMQVLEWIDSQAARLSRLAVWGEAARHLPLVFCTLRENLDADLLSFLWEALSNVSFCSVPVGSAYREYLAGLGEGLKKFAKGEAFALPERPASETMGDIWERFLRQLLEMKPKRRGAVARLLGAILPPDLVSRTLALDLRARRQETQILRLLRPSPSQAPPQRWPKGPRKEIKKLAGFEWDKETQRLLDRVQLALNQIPVLAEQEAHLEVWTRFLCCWPADARALRLRVLTEWERRRSERVWSDPEGTTRRFYQILAELTPLFLRRGVHERLLNHWSERTAADDLWNCGNISRRVCRRWAELLEATLYDRNLPLGDELLSSLGRFVQAAPDLPQASVLIGALAAREDDSYYEEEIRTAFALAGEDPDVASLLRRLHDDWKLVEPAGVLAEHLKDQRLRRIARQWLQSGRNKSFVELACLTRMVVRLGLSVPVPADVEAPTEWLTRYPGELRESLAELNRATPGAPGIAAHILRQEFPRAEDLRQEAQALRRRLDAAGEDHPAQDSWRKRLANLEDRLAHPVPVTSQRLQTLAQKISDRADHETVQRYVQECQTLVLRLSDERYGVQVTPTQLLEPPKDALLWGILQLNDPMRELGLRLLFQSIEDPTCDFRAEPRNAAFLKSLQKKGLDLGPWLDGSWEQPATTTRGEPYRLFLARRIEDVLLMGLHFDTCLSPQGENFFSAITNAVDINKRVLYGKTEAGRVIGRCLFALTDAGTLLTYRRYAHDPKDGFEEEANQFAQRLARAMNTVLADSGRVSTLVASKWYDDGAISCGDIYDLPKDDGPVRTILRNEETPHIVERLSSVLGSEGTLRGLLGPLLSLKEFEQRPEIVGPFLGRFAFDATIPLAVRLRLALAARRAGNGEAARQIVKSMGGSSLPLRLKRLACPHCGDFHDLGAGGEVFDLLIDCNPSLALRTFRLMRPHGVRSDAAEQDADRKEILARCYRALGRSR